MIICIDSGILIRALQDETADAAQVLGAMGTAVTLVIPRLIAQEVTRNLNHPQQIKTFYHLFSPANFAFIVDEPVPPSLAWRYTTLGLPAKADAYIGAFAEWMGVAFFLSDNRHFLRDLQTDAFQVITPREFLQMRGAG